MPRDRRSSLMSCGGAPARSMVLLCQPTQRLGRNSSAACLLGLCSGKEAGEGRRRVGRLPAAARPWLILMKRLRLPVCWLDLPVPHVRSTNVRSWEGLNAKLADVAWGHGDAFVFMKALLPMEVRPSLKSARAREVQP